jgi:hypothetical protein
MSRHLLNPSELQHPTDLTPPPAATHPIPAAETAAEPVGPVTFVKNLHPREKIRFADGTIFQWPSMQYVTSNAEEIARIRAVATKHHIVEKN